MGLEPNPGERDSRREAEFVRVVREHAGLMYRVAYGLLRHAQDAEDAVQDALLKLYRTGDVAGMQDERAYLARCAWRAGWDRMQRRMPVQEDGAAELNILELKVADGRATPEQDAAEADERGRLHALIDGLPEELREPLLLSAMEEMNSREIAGVMGIPEGTVRTRLMRARAQLREQWVMDNRTRPGKTAAARR